MKRSLMCLSMLIVFMAIPGCHAQIPDVPSRNEIVMSEGMKISVTNKNGTMDITAGKGLQRFYTWAGDTRSVIMWPREERWRGSLGIYFPGQGNHWKEHDGITRAVVEEGQQHFKSVEDAIEFLRDTEGYWVYRDDGLAVGWAKYEGAGGTLGVDVWQIYINGQKPTKLPGSQNDKITVEYPKN